MTSHFSYRRTPNDEQEKAIFHNGGKLLSAGAGSGKTFVLIEHLVYILLQIQKKTISSEWSKLIPLELSKIVLMTFTKKAAGEMSVRMMRRIEELYEEAKVNENQSNTLFWSLVRQHLASLNMTTIHGFCHRLLRMGFWNNFPQDINLVSSIEHKDKIQKLFDRWFKENRDNLDPIFLASNQSLLAAMVEIFSSPELRVLWMSPMLLTNAATEIDQFFLQLLEVKGYKDLFKDSFDLYTSEKEKNKKWYELLVQFNEVKNKYGVINASNYKNYSDFFKTISRFPVTNSKEISLIQKEILVQIRALKDDIKDLTEDLDALSDNFEIYKIWVSVLSDVFKYINIHYFDIDGFSFSDLEFYVLTGLKVQDVLVKVQESFTYFIVDEFQDTSYIQFEILKSLISGKQEKIFCVGDKKQAIYGFRGGELQVFSDCAKMLGEENNYFLKNNFRSQSSIIDFNNNLFELVFPLGLQYSGKDPHSVAMESQVIPIMKKLNNHSVGKVVSLRTEITNSSNDLDLDYLESLKLCEHIEMLLENEEYSSICILYRKLKPSAILLEHLLKKDIVFSAQIKIQFSDDPLMNIFLYLVEYILNKNDPKKKESTIFLIQTLLLVLEVSTFLPEMLEVFYYDQKILGFRLALHKFVFSLGLSNSFHAQNAELVDAICRLTKEDPVMIYHLLKNEEAEDYACEMMSGGSGLGNKKRIVIMSAHASKGLEFDAVLLGGIHTNGRYNGMKDQIGKFPHSFKWKKSFDKKHFYKSPFYYLEAEVLKLKDFSESKRLLYVACTRAVKYLAFVDMWMTVKDSPKNLYLYDNSWIQALRLITPLREESVLGNINQERVEIPLIQRDPLGMLVQHNLISLGLISELSVTRLATLADCPFKFYLQNICKIIPEKPISSFQEIETDENTNEDEVFYSSKKRGTKVHLLLSKIFKGEIDANEIPIEEYSKITWAYSLARNFSENYEIISEQAIKFSFFGQMISGTPDLVFMSPEEKLVVWDFKTGERNCDNEESYWFQLMSYAYAYAKLKHFTQEKKVEVSLLYLDQEEIISRIFSVNELDQVLFSFWKKTEFLNQVNNKHCSFCDYSTICKKGHC